MSFGPNPWQQTSWDWRAAGNFMAGGAGSGLIVFTLLSDAQGPARAALLLGGLALIGLGLLCVWLEIGRPLRALNVFFNPRSSWMTREAFTGALLMPCTLAAAFGLPGVGWPALALALLFVYTQSRIVMGARGIPAWREPRVAALLVSTGLVEGGGLFLLVDTWHDAGTPGLLVLFGVLVLARLLLWLAYRRRLRGRAAVRANQALDQAGRWLKLPGSLLPLAVVLLVAWGPLPNAAVPLLVALAGLAAALAGAWFKFTLITRAGFNQGFALQHLPVRGVHREAAAASGRPAGG